MSSNNCMELNFLDLNRKGLLRSLENNTSEYRIIRLHAKFNFLKNIFNFKKNSKIVKCLLLRFICLSVFSLAMYVIEISHGIFILKNGMCSMFVYRETQKTTVILWSTGNNLHSVF